MVGSGVVAAGSRRGAYSYSITSARLPSFSSREKGPLTALLGWERPIAGLGAPPCGYWQPFPRASLEGLGLSSLCSALH